jgi:hypothetical protein
MSTLHTLAAEPATLVYLATGAISLGWAKLTRSRRRKSTMMLICQRRSRMAMDSLDLL